MLRFAILKEGVVNFEPGNAHNMDILMDTGQYDLIKHGIVVVS